MPQVNKTYEDLVRFNNALKENKLNYLENISVKLQKEIDIKKREQQDFLEKNSDIIGLIKNNDIDKYDELNQELADVSKNVAKQEEIYATLDRFSKEEEELKKKIKDAKAKGESVTELQKEYDEKFGKNAKAEKLEVPEEEKEEENYKSILADEADNNTEEEEEDSE